MVTTKMRLCHDGGGGYAVVMAVAVVRGDDGVGRWRRGDDERDGGEMWRWWLGMVVMVCNTRMEVAADERRLWPKFGRSSAGKIREVEEECVCG
ncbi:hypothetical protein Tco_0536333 [Tanacetum coccineum]